MSMTSEQAERLVNLAQGLFDQLIILSGQLRLFNLNFDKNATAILPRKDGRYPDYCVRCDQVEMRSDAEAGTHEALHELNDEASKIAGDNTSDLENVPSSHHDAGYRNHGPSQGGE